MADLWESVARFLGLVFVDLLLAGDNAVVIALAARRLRGRMRRQAILLGAGGAVALRLALAAVVTGLLHVPLLQAVGGLLLLWIARKLVVDDRGGHDNVREAGNVWEAVQTIILADVVMSLDNVLALVGVSGGHLGLLVMGLALSVPLIVWGSSLLSGLMDRWPWLIYVGAGILVWVAVEMMLKDRVVHAALVGVPEGVLLAVHIVATLLLTGFFILQGRRAGATPTPEVAAGTSPATGGTHAPGASATDEPGSDGMAPGSQRPQAATGRQAPTEPAGPAAPAPASRPGGALTRAAAEPARPGVEPGGTPVAPAAAPANPKPQGPRTGAP
ncbi:Integral membrane protein TerC [Thermaerobacter marianensis DSM 12885]|uniref:Integral membrane protein TerC n=1 Tax=Thermaerobacter marianensis (strain ATCC 700841 / DSM 12885 / JCM 10246 / 7p75a) TaxID=644966 RepID=E6SJ71_THEM7|nr:TerC family protein [Thermaerobacter marianensis]ADU52095.1 Integral membrane protein TerC [Thermaerobacter marianensis DSM 12885]